MLSCREIFNLPERLVSSNILRFISLILDNGKWVALSPPWIHLHINEPLWVPRICNHGAMCRERVAFGVSPYFALSKPRGKVSSNLSD